ncbi:phosphoenolpyruvate-protein phosphotransferase [Spirochaetia bacterium]|nr:phosphoenolpyruvate-protein phosphotransferase [Spirochaetia bacterium]
MIFHGLPVSKGIAIGRAFVYEPFKPNVTERIIDAAEAAEHTKRLDEVLAAAGKELELLQQKMAGEDPDKVGIFEAHQDILTDTAVIEEILELINKELYAGEYAIETIYENYFRLFSEMDDALMRERCADFRDVKNRMLRLWMQQDTPAALQTAQVGLDAPSIIFAKDLLPSDTAALDRKTIQAFVTETGGYTSHSAIIARSYEIPAILGVEGFMDKVKNGDTVIVDAVEGILILEPSAAEIAQYTVKYQNYKQEREEIKKYRAIEPLTADGERISVCLNIGSASEEELAAAAFTDGSGLFRSEFLFMSGRELPGENEQFQIYKKAAETFGKKQVILRTLDIGGDKSLECMELPKEENPFLGCRALRLCFERPDIFKTQLRAALRAGVYGNLALMFPMVGSLEDLRRAKEFLAASRRELESEKIPCNKNMAIGIMIEIPAIALIADRVAKEVDFASIGTNDLCQYLTATDRMNPGLAPYYQSYHPSMFGLINQVSQAFIKAGKTLSICGEMGGDPAAVPAFIGMGIKKFSMSASGVPVIKRMLTRLTMEGAKKTAAAILNMDTAGEIETYLKQQLSQRMEGEYVRKENGDH